MSLAVHHSYRFGDYTLDANQKVLLRQGKPLPLTPKLFDTLLILVENSGRIVQKDELMSRLWPDTFVEEANLTSNILQLRKCLGDSARKPIYIETVARRGYRFIAPVTENGDDLGNIYSPGIDSLLPVESRAIQPNGHTSTGIRRSRLLRQLLAFVAIAILITAIIGAWRLRPHSSSQVQTVSSRVMLAVLPFKNLT